MQAPRPRQARSVQTRQKLLTATRDMLVERGYARTSTQDIVHAAGVSQGALFRHFPNKVLLMAETFAYVSEETLAEFVARFAARDGEEVTAGIEAAWAALDQPTSAVVLELLIAARTDAELRAAIQPAAVRLYVRVYRDLLKLGPAAAGHRHAGQLLWLMLDALLGRILGNLAGSTPTNDAGQRALLARMVQRELESGPVAG